MSGKQGAKRLLQNLKTYKLACNDVDPIQIESYRKLYGNDEGRILGALMTVRSTEQQTNDDVRSLRPSQKRKRRRRKKSKQQKKKTEQQEETQQLGFVSIESGVPSTSLSLPPTQELFNKLVEYSSDSSNDANELCSTDTQRFELPMFLRDDIESSSVSRVTPPNPKPHTLDSDTDSDTMGYFNTVSDDGSSSNSGDEKVTTATGSSNIDTIPSLGQQLSSHVCYKCGKIGHMSNDCLVSIGIQTKQRSIQPAPREVRILITKCRKLKNDKNASCAMCGIHSNLANCLDCGLNICDGRGHLVKHLLDHSSHVTLFSFKLGKIVKCCKPSCGVVNCYQLLMCSTCFSKIFSQHYSMITATWSVTGLKAISNLLCCDDHFEWHRMNCQTSDNEFLISKEKLKSNDGTLSDFVF